MPDPRQWATRGLLATATLDRRTADPVLYADRRTSLADWRASLSIALGVDPGCIGPLGHDYTPSHVRAQVAALLIRAADPMEPPGVDTACSAAVADLRAVLGA